MFEGYNEKQPAMLIAGETYSRYTRSFGTSNSRNSASCAAPTARRKS